MNLKLTKKKWEHEVFLTRCKRLTECFVDASDMGMFFTFIYREIIYLRVWAFYLRVRKYKDSIVLSLG